MHVTGIRLKNFARFRGEHEIAPLDPKGYAIVARLTDDDQRSNFLGKTTIATAIRYALFGVLPDAYETLDDAISRGEDEMTVEVELSDGTFIARERMRGKWTRLMCSVDGAVHSVFNQDAAQEEIVRRIGLDRPNYDACAGIAQKQADRFSTMRSSELTDVINGWLGLDKLVEAEDAATKGLAQLNRELAIVEADAKRVEWASPEEGARLKAEFKRLKTSYDHAFEQEKQDAGREALRELWLDHKKRADRATNVRELLAAARSELEPIKKPDEQEARRVFREAGELRHELEAVQRERRALENVEHGKFDGACPVLPGFECPAKAKINESTAEARKQLDAKKFQEEQLVTRYRAANAALKTVNDVEAHVGLIEARIARLEGELEPLLASEQYVTEHVEPSKTDADVADPEPYRQAEQELKRWTADLARLTDIKPELEKRRARVAALRVACLALEQAQRRISEGAVQRIEAGGNARLARAGIDIRVEFRWGRETNKLATRCGQCGSVFPVSQKVKQCVCGAIRGPKIEPKLHLRFSARSGAVEDLAGVALSLAASRWLRSRRGAEWGTVVLDEPFASLDAAHRRALTGHLNQLVSDGFEQAFVVAHSRDVLDSLPGRIEVVGDGEWSSVRVVV